MALLFIGPAASWTFSLQVQVRYGLACEKMFRCGSQRKTQPKERSLAVAERLPIVVDELILRTVTIS